MTDRKKPGVTFWATVLLVVLLLYALSFGAYIWLLNQHVVPEWAKSTVGWIYFPFWWLTFEGPESISAAMVWYMDLWGGLEI